MPYKASVPFRTVILQLTNGGDLIFPLDDMNAVRVGEKYYQLQGQYAEQFQKKVLDKGNPIDLLSSIDTTAFENHSITVYFDKAKDGFSFPDFSIQFDCLAQPLSNGTRVVIPALALEVFITTPDELWEEVEEAIRLEFVRSKRLNAVQEIVAAIWYEAANMREDEILYRFLTPMEVYEAKPEDQASILKMVARKLHMPKHQVTFRRAAELQEMTAHLKNEFNRNVLLVGASGVGKTALVQELLRINKSEKLALEIWETTASRMIKGLTTDMGWQDNLSKLCQEVKKKKVILFIRNLKALFEVGKYEGNAISMAEYLQPYLSRGEITIITECTDEELTAIEVQSPQYSSFFHILKLTTPKQGLEDIVIKKINALTKSRKIAIESEAVKEVIRMNMRFTPYSGFPGKPIRFIENLLTNNVKLKSIDKPTVIKSFCEETGMPPFIVDPAIPMDVEQVRTFFKSNLFGQNRAIDSVVNTLAAIKTALMRKGKPIASFLFVGPTGVGKTELAKVLAQFMFGNRDRMVRFDMSEYAHPSAMNRLIGTPYQDGTLTAAIRREPFSVLLFDELEKADAKFYDLLLQVLDEGRLTDNSGKLVNFCSTIIIMTSNIGASKRASIQVGKTNEDETTHYITAVKKHFRPELYNRIDEIIPFASISRGVVRFVVDREIKQLKNREGIKFRPLQLHIADEVLGYLATKGYDPKYGARYLQRTIREELILPLAQVLNREDYFDRLEVKIELIGEQIAIDVTVDPKGVDSYLDELDKIVNTDFVSRLRRSIHSLLEGVFYIELTNELDLLKQRAKKDKDKFWADKALADKYSYLLETTAKVDALKETIEGYEMQMSLNCIGFEGFDVDLEKVLEDWKAKFFAVKQEMYQRIYPNMDKGYIGIYGANLKPILDFYLQLFEQKHIEYKIESVWFNDKYFQKAVQANKVAEADDPYHDPFFKVDFDATESSDWEAPEKNFKLYGLEFKLKGACCGMYMQPEEGVHRWKFSPKEEYRYKVIIQKEAYRTPHNINRKDFYTQENPRRTIDRNHVRDSLLDLNREFQKGQLTELVVDKLNELFEIQLNAELL